MEISRTLPSVEQVWIIHLPLSVGWGEGNVGTRRDWQTPTAWGVFFSLSLCHKGHPRYCRCVWEQLQKELLILLSTPTVYSWALPTSLHPEENYTGTGHAKGHPMKEIRVCNWLCIPIWFPNKLATLLFNQATHWCTWIKKMLQVVGVHIAMQTWKRNNNEQNYIVLTFILIVQINMWECWLGYQQSL